MRISWVLLGIVLGALLALLLVDIAPAQEIEPVFDPGAWGVSYGPRGKTAIMWNTEMGAAYIADLKGKQWTRMLFLKWTTSGDADDRPTEEIVR